MSIAFYPVERVSFTVGALIPYTPRRWNAEWSKLLYEPTSTDCRHISTRHGAALISLPTSSGQHQHHARPRPTFQSSLASLVLSSANPSGGSRSRPVAAGAVLAVSGRPSLVAAWSSFETSRNVGRGAVGFVKNVYTSLSNYLRCRSLHVVASTRSTAPRSG